MTSKRWHCVILLAVGAFLAGVNSSAALNGRTVDHLHPDVLSRRALRYNSVKQMDVEERSVLSKIAGAVAKVRPSAHNIANKMWLKFRTNPEVVFKELDLRKTGVKLANNPAFLQWVKYVDMYNAKKGNLWFSENSIFKLLQKSKPEAELVVFFHSLQQVRRMSNFAD
ncbi:hypothetical protein PI124_g16003 [Phytophthora idaei]|nr:hypothetical protein PI125_g16210 [Phytophthora idaei]KAG3142297.1 hypothetical protein PI126_g15103 [Phytophthora idaei]KAG3239053.1 hypothetical protein PI124_g16003 [Phytophthora idaei]